MTLDPSSTVSIRICQEGHANALALNKECTQIAVAGRSLLKVYSIDSNGFSEVCNMRGGKNQNLSYSSNDVAWSALDTNLLATAATNGVVSVWDLSKFGRQKQLFVYNEHERTAHTVTFHQTESNLLISGSQDGTIKCFDLRMEKAVHTYFSNSESVRDVKFSPQYPNMFAAVSENGTVQLWDLKKPDKCQSQFTAHSGPIYTCDWHPNQPWLATGSRDKQIKVWNMEHKPSLEYTIHTIAVVGRVKWRPERMYHIASCALVVDYSIYIWDVRRPYIPYAAFNEHTNVTTGIAWKGSDPHILMSASKDSSIFKHAFKDAMRPNARANPQGTSLNHKGDLLFSYKIKNVMPTTAPVTVASSRNSFLSSRPKQQIPNEQFHLAKSYLISYNAKQQNEIKDASKTSLYKDYLSFQGCAKEYCLIGKSLSELCDLNAEVARKYGKSNVSMLWKFVKNQYSMSAKQNQNNESRNSTSSQVNNMLTLPTRMLLTQNSNSITPGWGGGGSGSDATGGDGDDDDNDIIGDDDIIRKMCCEDLRQQDFRHPKSGEFKHPGVSNLNLIPNGLSSVDSDTLNNFMYGEAELTVADMDCVKSLRNGFLYIGPHDLSKCWSLPSNTLVGHDKLQTSRSPQELARDNRQQLSPPPDLPSVLKIFSQPNCSKWEPHEILAESLVLQTDVGDVQTAVCILIVLGDRRNDLPIDEITHEIWLLSYIELLHRHKMYNEATEIIKMSWIRTVCEINQQSTLMHTNCGDCGKPLSSSGWYCNKCKSPECSKCSVCNRVVTGLYAWCQGCSHGGHLQHMKQWFSNHSKCPKCGHLCEYE